MSSNIDFYKKAGSFFLGIILVLVTARFTVLKDSGDGSYQKTEVPSYQGQKSGKVIGWRDAGKYYGQNVTIEGKIVKTYNSGKACFLNFHPDYKRYFTAVIFRSAFDRFPECPENHCKNKKVRVTGTIKEYNGSPEIILNSPSQIKIIK
ncbi:MAG: OB-fold nucleic acid binding domain-containing protein [Candidatus Omnitrophica bacterium]|nr:OB-fold nucleic acid binding domain-containing protein [Candidatus Omnitrophota bacterium]